MIVACWSGPRNLSTAMMYAFGSRADFAVRDEPFYAAYLAATGLAHPMGAEIIAAGETDPAKVARACATPAPGRAHLYQKHMTHHMLDGFDTGWCDAAVHVFLIRHPARVLASYAAKREDPVLEDIGFVQQAALYAQMKGRGLPCCVIDSYDIRQAPGPMLSRLCDAIGLSFDPAMLSWPAGGHPDDGVWAAHWYDAVHRSTGFAGAEGPLPELPASLEPVAEAAMPHYRQMQADALTAG